MPVFQSPLPPIDIADVTVTELLFKGLIPRGDAVVVVDGPSGREVTARQIVETVKALAGGLSERGFGAGAVVALMGPNIPEFISIYHAVAWAGGTITTVNPTYTAEELHHQLQDSGATLLIVLPQMVEAARGAIAGTRVTEIVAIGEAEGATALAALMGTPIEAQVPVDPATHVVVLPYSSGTTGLPKGVMLTHRNLVANVLQIQPCRKIQPGEWTIGFLPFFHIYGMTILINTYLSHGGQVITMPRFDLPLFLKLAQDYKVRQLFVVPPVVLALAKHPMVDDYDLSGVECAFSGAAPLGSDLCRALEERLGFAVEQGFGLTELSPASHISVIGQGRSGFVGPTIPSTETRIVDSVSGADVAFGEQGEVWVRGPQVMKGYLNNPEATAQTITAEGWLKTGDIGVIEADGQMRITDRLKELIKVKAFQVAPAELEAVLVSHPEIADAAVIGIADAESGQVPMAVLVAREGAELTLEKVQGFVGEHLAHYKQVHRIELVAEIPKSASGKILRRILREQYA